MRILVADDDFVGRAKLKAILSKYGECTAVSNGELALRMYREAVKKGTPYDLVSMDIDMPGLRGQQVVRRIRRWEKENKLDEQGIQARILMVSSMRDRDNVLSSFQEGCESYVSKPVTPANIGQALQELGLLPMEIPDAPPGEAR